MTSTRAPITAATVTSAPSTNAGPRPAQTTPATMSNPRSSTGNGFGTSYRPRSRRRNTTPSSTTVTTQTARAGAHISGVNATPAGRSRAYASRLVRFDTGRTSEAVLASQTAVKANSS